MKRFCHTLLVSVFILGAVVGCATAPPVTDSARPLRQVSDLPYWEFGGRAVLHRGKRSWRVGIRWRQQADEFQISLMSLLGQQIARLHGDAGEVVLYRPKQESVAADSPSALLAEEFGWLIPIEGLRYWVLGLPAPGVAGQGQRDQSGILHQLEQQGWFIRFDHHYQDHGIWLPGRLHLERSGFSVRLVIDRWQTVRES